MYSNLISNIQSFEYFTDEELNAFTSILTVKNIAKGDFFLREGQISSEIAYIDSGLQMHYSVHEGEIIPVDFAIEDTWLANLKSYSSGQPADLNIVALEDSLLLVLNKSSLKQLFDAHPKFSLFQNHQVEKALIDSTKHAANLAMLTAKERYYKLMKEKPYLLQRVPQYYLAKFLGIKPQSLSRIRKESIDGGS